MLFAKIVIFPPIMKQENFKKNSFKINIKKINYLLN